MFVPLGLSAIVITAQFFRYKLKSQELEMRGSDPQLGPAGDTLRHDLDDTRAQLADLQARLDFTERLLADRSALQEDTSA